MNLQDPIGSHRILENPVGSFIGFLPGITGIDGSGTKVWAFHFIV